MEDWLQPQASSTSQQRFQEPDQPDCLSGYHHWYATSHARPTYCNVCREALSGVTSHGLSCEVCKCKVHKRCSIKAINNCKWTTLASVGREIIEDQDGIITMPHQWIEGNLPVSSKCIICEKTCGSVLRLQDWRCLWCRGTVHTACRPLLDPACPLGPARVSVVPPTALHCIQDEAWDVIRPQASSPLLVFVNSKSGENQGVKFLRRFKQLLNPAQVFDLIPSGPRIGLRLFRHFDPFRILICSGDGSVGWVLSEIDKLDMQKQCQIAVLPLGTGNDLSRVLGWGSSCDDDTHLPQLLEKYERASTKMLDRWSIMTFERTYSMPKLSLTNSQIDIEIPFTTTAIMQYEESLISYLHNILQSDEPTVVLNSVKYLYTSVKNFVVQVSESPISKDCKHLSTNCDVLQQKLESLLETLTREEVGFVNYERDQTVDIVTKVQSEHSESGSEKLEKDISNIRESKRSQKVFIQREELVSRANSLKKAIHELVTQTEQAVQKQNVQMESIQETSSGKKHFRYDSKEMDTLKVMPTIEVASNNEPSSVPRSRSQSLMSARLTSISPLPDFHRDSVCEETNSLLTLPVPTEFADSRRSSGVAAEVQSDADGRLLTTLGLPEFVSNEEKLYPEQRIDSITQIDKSTKVAESGDVVSPDSVAEEQDNSNIKNDYFDDKECSSILSAISNEEVSIASEILDQKSFCPRKNSDGEDINGHIYHIDSPEMSETYLNSEALQGESLMDDIGSLLCQDAFFNMAGFDQDSIDTSYTDDTTLFTSDTHDNKKDREVKNRSFKQKHIEDIETQFGFENRAFMTQNKFLEKDNRCDDQKLVEPIKYCSLAHFVEGNDIARKSFKRGRQKSTKVIKTEINMNRQSTLTEESEALSNIKLELKQTSYASDISNEKQDSEIANSIEMICPPKDSEDPNTNPTFPAVSVVVEPPSPVHSGDVSTEQFNQISNMNSEFNLSTNNMNELSIKSSSQYDLGKDDFLRNYLSPYSTTSSQHSSNSNLLGIDLDQLNFLKGSPAATRRISSGSLLKANEVAALAASASSMHSGSKECISDKRDRKDDKEEKKKEIKKTLPIINPLVRLPTWPNVNCGAGFIEKCLLANADALCAAVSPLMDPDETLLEGFIERCVMNNYFGIGIDAKISLDFHNKREEHPEKCRSRAKNYMWYGVLGSKQWLQRTYRNLEQRVQLECDGTRIPLPSLQGIVILNIPSFMGGTNFWGGRKENDCFLAPSFDDRILEVVAVFGSVQMAASRLINLQHHRIAQCQTVQINILGDEGVPVQVDGEAWVQPPGMIRIIHKNRMQMLCRNRSLESSLKTWEEKQRNHNSTASSSISSQLARSNVTFLRQSSQFLTTNIHEKSQRNSLTGKITPLINIEKPPPVIFVHSSEPEIEFSEDESELLLNFIECSTTLVKWVKILAISHINIDVDVYSIAMKTETCLENIHPNGKILEGEDLRIEFTKLVDVIKHLYEECCCLLRDKGHLLKLREDLESKLSVALANMEMELRKCTIVDTSYGSLMYLQPIQDEQSERKNRKGLFWLKFRTGKTVSGPKEGQAKDVVSWGTHEVATWLDMLQMSEYIDSFTKNDIRGRELLTLARRDLKDLGVTKVGHVKRILQAIKDLNQG